MKFFARIIVAIVLFFISLPAIHAQDFSNKGKDFWFTFPAHVDGTGAVMGIYITSDKAASGNVSFGTTNLPFTVTPNGVSRIFLGAGGTAPNTSVYLSTTGGITFNAAIHVTSDQPVVVYAHIIRSARSGASLILPTAVWGKEYLVPSYSSTGSSGANSGYGIINVVAKEANTTVEIVPKVASLTGLPAGTPYTVTLSQPGDVYQVLHTKDQDISGTIVRSVASGTTGCKPIAVFSATTWSAFDCAGASGGDNLYQQLFPTRSFGKTFLTAPFFNRQEDIIRVFAPKPNSNIRKIENGITTNLTVGANGFVEFQTNNPTKILADSAIMVVQYMNSQTCDSRNAGCGNNCPYPADPEMVVLSPVEQTINNITVFSAHQSWVPPNQSNVNKCYLNIIIQSSAAPSFKINGATPNGTFLPINGTNYSYLQEDVTSRSISNPIQTLTADSSFSAIAYGYGNVESYGYNAGTNVKDLFQYITINNEYETVKFPATCVNSPFHFGITLPYPATQLKWVFNGLFPDTTVNNPMPDSSFVVDGRTLYQYKLPSHYIIGNIGTFKISVFATNPTSDGCSGEQQIDYDVEVYAKPKADFTWTHTGCVTDSVKFSDQSNGNGRVVNRWKWEFGDNTIDSVKNPVKKYASPGVYTIKQSIITDIGCVADTTKIIDVTLPPTAGFTVSAPTCVGSNISFTDNSTSVGSNIVKWYWDFGNGKKDTVASNAVRTVVYTTVGTYTVSLIVETQSGCKSIAFTKTVTINPYPVANFALPTAVCLPVGLASFTNQSTISDGTQASFQFLWNFGDGGTSTVQHPQHNYNSVGPFNVNLRVTSAAGCIKDTIKTLSAIYPQPKAGFTVQSEVCLRDTTKIFTQSNSLNPPVVTNFYWNYGDGKIDSVAKDPTHVYSSEGTFSIRHWVVTDKGCMSDTAVVSHLVNPLPAADFISSSPLCETQEITFTDKSIANAGTINRWQFNLGDGTSIDQTSFTTLNHSYTTFGNKQLWMVVSSSKGCMSDTLRKTIAVHALPQPTFILPEVCLTDAFATFTNTTTIADGSAALLTWKWSFGDPGAGAANTSLLKNPQHKYNAVGSYPVELIATSKDGCSDTLVQSLTVNGDKPKADFIVQNATALCSNIPVSIQNKSSVNFGSITKTEIYWEWPSVASVTVDNDPQADEVYTNLYTNFQAPVTKTVQIRFLAYSGGVCVNEVIKTITLNASPAAVLSTIPGICLDATPRLITQGKDAGNLVGTFTYSGTAISAVGLFTPATAGVGTYTLQYLHVSAAGCRDSAKQTITVWPRPTANFSVDVPMCETQPVTLRDASVPNFSNVSKWDWSYGDGNLETRTSGAAFTHSYSSAGTVNVVLTVTTDSGCVSLPVTKSVKVNPLPKVDFSLPVVCMPAGAAIFTDASTIADGSQAQFTYLWNFGIAGATSTQRNPTYNYPAVASYNVKLVVTSKDGCKDSLTKVLSDVNPQPMANFTINPVQVCLGAPFAFADASNALNQTVVSRNWDFGNGQTSNSQNPTIAYAQAGTYNVKLYYTTNKGCVSDTSVKSVTVHPYPVVSAGPDLNVLEGGQAVIKATVSGSSNYQFLWTPASYLSSATVQQPTTTPLDDITYKITVTGAGGCQHQDDVFVKVLLAPVIPNTFSPNGDGINDTWMIKFIDSYPGAVIQVFDRYGRNVFKSIGYNTPWDGKLNGGSLPIGVYYYVIDPKNGRKAMTGSVTIVL